MCSRFFIDFPDLNQQQAKLENYLYNHFQSSEDQTKYHYLMILYQVVDESTVCLMGHERRLTLTLIEDMAFQVCQLGWPPEDNMAYFQARTTPPVVFWHFTLKISFFRIFRSTRLPATITATTSAS